MDADATTGRPDALTGDRHDHLDPLIHVAQVESPDELAEARAAAGRAVRDIGHALVGHQAPIELIDRISRTLDDLSAELDAYPARSRSEERPTGDWGPAPADGDVMTSYDERPVSGRASPWGLDLHIVRDGHDALAHVTLRAAHEGAPGRSHGGVVAALFDDVYGFVLTMHAQPAFTGQLGIRYQAGTPIGVPLECRVRLDRREGRKLFMTGELLDTTAGTVVATSTATFIAIEPEAFRAGAG
jgi:acyl-coenzyme A thioesterase PaaI-like protein